MENSAKTEVLRVRAVFEPFYALIALALVLIGGVIAGFLVYFVFALLAIFVRSPDIRQNLADLFTSLFPFYFWGLFYSTIFLSVGWPVVSESWRALCGGSVLELDEQGFACPGRFDGRVAWSDVARISRGQHKDLIVRLRPGASDRLKWRGVEGFFRRRVRIGGSVFRIWTTLDTPGFDDAKRMMLERYPAARPGAWAPLIGGFEARVARFLARPILSTFTAAFVACLCLELWPVLRSVSESATALIQQL
jgi:hypothetical protein